MRQITAEQSPQVSGSVTSLRHVGQYRSGLGEADWSFEAITSLRLA
jgi:hypothetical protein